MRCSVVHATLCSALLLAAAGCAVEDPGTGPGETQKQEEPTKQKEEAILGGSADNANDAVVFLLDEDQGGACTGTIIAVNGNTGYVLTAGHCSGMDYIVQDDNIACLNNDTCDGIYLVDSGPGGDTAHPQFNGNNIDHGYDFRILRFQNASGAPVIPAASSDGLNNNSNIELSGYGLTESGNTSDQRLHVTMSVDYLATNEENDPVFVVFDQGNGSGNGIGTCNGDSGGPGIFNGKVVAVTSFGDENCNDVGVSGRVQAVYNDFIAPIIGGQVIENCDTCFDGAVNSPNGACADEVQACLNAPACNSLIECINGCSNETCQQNCLDENPGGQSGLAGIIDCYCTACAGPCSEECGTENPTTTTTTTTTTTSTGNSMNGGDGGNSANGGSGSGANSGDGGSSADGEDDAAEDGDSEDGCGCRLGSKPNDANAWFGLVGAGLAIGAMSRRRRK